MKTIPGFWICLTLVTASALGQDACPERFSYQGSRHSLASGWQAVADTWQVPEKSLQRMPEIHSTGGPPVRSKTASEAAVCHWQPTIGPNRVFSGSSFTIGPGQYSPIYPTLGDRWIESRLNLTETRGCEVRVRQVPCRPQLFAPRIHGPESGLIRPRRGP